MYKNIPYCEAPWRTLHFNAHSGEYAPCCHFFFKKSNFKDKDVDELFNSKEMKNLRKRLTEHDVKGLPCEECIDLLYKEKNYQTYGQKLDFYSEHKRVHRKIKKSFNEGEIELDYLPVDLFFYTSEKCNLKCIFCIQNQHNDDFLFKNFKKIIEPYGTDELDMMQFVGGETLLNEDALQMIEYIVDSPYSNNTIFIVTNGTLIKKRFELLKKIKNGIFIVSMDGFGKNYEKIRKGSNWESFIENIYLLKELKDNNTNIKVLIRSIVMKSTLNDLENIIDFASKLNFELYFSPLFFNNTTAQLDENFYFFARLIDKDRFLNHIDNLIKKTKKLPITSDSLRVTKEYFFQQTKRYYEAYRYFQQIGELIKHKPIVLFGASRYAKEIDTLGILDLLNVVAFADHNKKLIGTKYLNKDVIDPKDIKRYSNIVLIASTQYEENIFEFLTNNFTNLQIFKPYKIF